MATNKKLTFEDWIESSYEKPIPIRELKRSGANIAFISESLGHTDLQTTENYLASFEKEERIKNTNLLTNF